MARTNTGAGKLCEEGVAAGSCYGLTPTPFPVPLCWEAAGVGEGVRNEGVNVSMERRRGGRRQVFC